MIVYQRIENEEILDREYLVDFVYHEDKERVEQYNSVRSNIKIYAREGYIDAYASPRPKVDLEIYLQDTLTNKTIRGIWLYKVKWSKANEARFSQIEGPEK